MIAFFRRADWFAHRHPRGEPKPANVNESWWIAECDRLLTGPLTDTDRRETERVRQAWLASREAGC